MRPAFDLLYSFSQKVSNAASNLKAKNAFDILWVERETDHALPKGLKGRPLGRKSANRRTFTPLALGGLMIK
uniref:Uncharacterized protein n=1 Tax=Magnetococcus massalia (strain MO-1) TaxID=451514 RepID=A0A1S7LJK5_MAGMO|nr:Protein of unknown function [Candidatus Magnetococcus massalia]